MDQQQPAGAPAAPAKGGSGKTIACVVLAAVLGCGGLGVVGVLAAIAIPNFIKYQCKAKQSEARAELRGLYVAEKSFYAEYGFYTSDLVSLGWSPSSPSPRYLYGFSYPGPDGVTGAPPGHDVERSHTADEEVVRTGGYSTANMKTADGDPLAAEDLFEDSYVERDEFVAAAVGDIQSDAFGTRDIWTIDQDNNLTALENDCGGSASVRY